MTKRMTAFGLALAGLGLGLAGAVPSEAQSWPTRPVKVLVTSTAGGPLDVFTRLVTNKLEERFKQPFVVENRAGAGGNLAVGAALLAPADGYTILSSIDTTFTVNPAMLKQLPFDPEKDFVPISVLAKFGQALGVPADLPVASVKDLLALSTQRNLNYGSAGVASPSHLSFSFLQAVTGIRANHIPYKGNPPALLSLTTGETQAVMVISTSLLPMAREKKVKVLAYSDRVRSEAIPDVPTMIEVGYPGFEVVFAYAFLVRTGTPRAVIEPLVAESTRAVMSPEVRDKLRPVDTIPIALPPDESAAWLRTNRARWTDVVTRMKITPE